MRNAEFHHPRLVEVYDAECPWSEDDDFFRSVVNETPGARVLDLGCGTGRLTVRLAADGHTVTGVDPAAASLAAARAKQGAEGVTWIEGTSATAGGDAFDVALMTSHVAQFLLTDAEWVQTLDDLVEALVSGGRVTFDTRDPADRAWERWTPEASKRRLVLGEGQQVVVWTEVTAVHQDLVDFTHHYDFGGGDLLHSEATLRFRTEDDIRQSLRDAGFRSTVVYGGWQGQPVGAGAGELIVVATT